jgi:hypothetical protein
VARWLGYFDLVFAALFLLGLFVLYRALIAKTSDPSAES